MFHSIVLPSLIGPVSENEQSFFFWSNLKKSLQF